MLNGLQAKSQSKVQRFKGSKVQRFRVQRFRVQRSGSFECGIKKLKTFIFQPQTSNLEPCAFAIPNP
jgi:hypothetical protein